MEEQKEVKQDESAVIKAVREEYEKKFAEQEEKHKQEINEIIKREEEKRINDIKSLMTGRKEVSNEGKVEDTELDELSYGYVYKETMKKCKVKGEN